MSENYDLKAFIEGLKKEYEELTNYRTGTPLGYRASRHCEFIGLSKEDEYLVMAVSVLKETKLLREQILEIRKATLTPFIVPEAVRQSGG